MTVKSGEGSDGPSAAKAVKLEDESRVLKKVRSFTPFKDILDIDWSDVKYRGRLKRLDNTYFIAQGEFLILEA